VALVMGSLLSLMAFAVTQENEAGAAIYKKRCLMCHGEDGVGDTKAGKMTKTPDINVAEWKNGKTVAELVTTLREGLGKMPKYEGKLSDEELTAVSEYTINKFVQ
jgi:mono/diheme cytochrome c family protein